MDKENARNTIVFVVCAVVLMIAYQFFILGPRAKERAVAARAQAELVAKNPIAAAAPGAQIFVDRAQAVAASPRVPVENPAVKGSIALQGGRIDDLFLKDYKQTLAKDSPPVELFRPEGAKQAYFADFGWAGQAGTPTPKTLWTQTAGSRLAPGQPVTLTWDNGQGLTFTRQIALDDRYMFTVTDTVANRGAAPVRLAPYASVQRQGLPADMSATNILHEGAVGYFADQLRMIGFKKWTKGGLAATASTGGWLGVTDKYWLAAVIPDQKEAIQGSYRVSQVNGVDVYEANFVGPDRAVAPGAQSVQVTRVFAGAKKVSVLKDYQDQLGVPRFDNAVDWGNFWFLTRPIFWLLEQFHKAAGNFGLSILMLTVFVRGLFFPLANKSYESVTKMKKVQPQLDELKKKYGSDPAKQQQEMMALYSREKINPLAGCVPILFQLPVFYALYKVLFVTIEMRHAPFVGWVHDLSAADPTTVWNLFGLIPYDPGSLPVVGSMLVGLGFLHIGLWPIIYGFTMWLSTSMSPMPTADPTQKLIFQLFPIVFTVMLAHSPVGLVIYWSWSSILTVLQQYVIMRRYKVDNPIDEIIRRLRGRAGRPEMDAAFKPEAIEAARVLFAHPVRFLMGAAEIPQLPEPDLPEVAFAGRSNVGKSSLINALTGRHGLARASNEPGRTREVNLFLLDERMRLVDLPGYGFARAAKSDTAKFQNLGRAYLRGRPTLKRVYLLIDARHGLKSADTEALDALDQAAVSYQIVLTKADKLRTAEAAERVAAETLKAVSRRPAAFPRIAVTSSETGRGIPELRAEIVEAAQLDIA